MKPNHRSIIEKADIAVANLISTGGYLNPMQSNTFIRMMIDQPTLLNVIRVVPMNAPTMELNKIGFASRILHAAPTSGTALDSGDRSSPTTDKVSLLTKEIIAEVHIPYDVLEDNIERGSLENTIMAMIAERASLDLEELIILGDTDSADTYLALVDGILVQAQSHIVDYVDGGGALVTKDIFKHGIKTMPNKYLRNRASMRFFVSPDVETEYADTLAARQTPLGDNRVQVWTPNSAFGVPVVGAALMPDSQYIFTYPQNCILGVQRSIQIETDRDIRTREIIIVLTMRIDVKFEEEDAVVKALGLTPNDDSPVTTTT
jgi:HK97 family phage major capsid protein